MSASTKSKLHLGDQKQVKHNTGKAAEARELLESLINRGISTKQRGALAVRITFAGGMLKGVREIWELDTNSS